MMNLIRADFYRVSKSWVTYAPFAALLLVHAVVMIFFRSYSGGIAYVESMLLTSNLVFLIFVVPFVFCVSVPSFADSTMKNDISWGMSRTKLYLSKLLVLIMLAVLLYVFYIGSGLALATVISGDLGDTAPGHWVGLLQAMGAQLLVVLAVCSVMMFLSFLLKKPYVLTEALFVVLLIPMIIDIIANLFNADLSWVLYFDLMSTMARFVSFSLLDGRTILIAFGVVAVWMIASSVTGIALLRKAEIK